MWGEILWARAIPRETLLYKEKEQEIKDEITLNITYYPAFQNIKNILKKRHVTLSSDEEHKKVFP